jgi:hypothetical protein
MVELSRCCLQGHPSPESVCGFADGRWRQKRVVHGRRLLFVKGLARVRCGQCNCGLSAWREQGTWFE